MIVASLCLVWLLFGLCAAVLTGDIRAASPSPGPGYEAGGDTRTSGQGPGLVGSPFFAIGGVLLVALVSIGLTQVYLRVTPDEP